MPIRPDGPVAVRPGETPSQLPSDASRLPRWFTFAVMPFLWAFVVTVGAVGYRNHQQLLGRLAEAHPQAASTVTINPLRRLMSLSDLPQRPAPDFTLTDQYGASVSLAALRGKAVLLAFLDARCTEVCPVLAQEFRVADQELGSSSSRVVFVAVNVNPMAESIADVQRFDALHGLTGMRNWHFLTGSTAKLSAVWRAYGIRVFVPKGASQTTHADDLYFITPKGQERYLASPQVLQRPNGTGYLPSPTLDQWGHGLAVYLRRLVTA